MERACRYCRRPSRQRGVALVTVLLVFAVVAVLAAAMVERASLNQRALANLMGARQAWYYALGGEAYARQLLALDLRQGTPGRDALDEAWARTAEGLRFEMAEEVELAIAIADLQGRFNLNNVVDAQGRANPAARAALERLLAAVGLEPAMAARWQDWVDADQVPQPDGAEDGNYTPYRTAGRPEAHPSTLRLVEGVEAAHYERLAPHVATLPQAVPVNVNTASEPVLKSLAPAMDGSRVRAILDEQRRGGFRSVGDFLRVAGNVPASAVTVTSSFFEVTVTARVGDYWQRLRTVVERDNNSGAIRVLGRERISLSEDRT